MAEAGSQLRGYVTVPERHAVVLSKLARLNDEKQSAIFQAAAGLQPTTMVWDSLRGALEKLLDEDEEEAKSLTAAMMGLFFARQRASESSDSDFVDAAAQGIKQAASKDNVTVADLRKTLVNVLALSNLELSYRASRVRFDSAYHFHDAGVVTDIRPIFDLAGTSIQGAVISHVLKIDYANSDEDDKFLYLNVDDADLDKLEAVIKRARRKAVALRAFAKEASLKIVEDKS